MTILIIIVILLGALSGYHAPEFVRPIEQMVEPVLCLMIFVSGLSVGYDLDMKKASKQIGIKIITAPAVSVLGSVLGGVLVAKFVGLPVFKSCTVASGLGWYSLSAIMITKYDPELAALAFMCNVFREILAMISIPLVAKYIGYFEAIAPGGATTMDTTLPFITRSTDENTTIIAFASGVAMLVITPALVQFFIGLSYGV